MVCWEGEEASVRKLPSRQSFEMFSNYNERWRIKEGWLNVALKGASVTRIVVNLYFSYTFLQYNS